MTQVFAYIRFSSAKQEGGDSMERQRSTILAYCERKGWELAKVPGHPNPFGDFGVSAWKGDHLKAGELGKFAERVRRGQVPRNSILVVEDLDRLSRQEPRITQRWLEDMADLGLRFAVVNGDKIFDAASLRANLFETFELLMKAHAAHEYVQKLSHRLKESWVRRRENAEKGIAVSAHAPGWLETIGERKSLDRHFRVIPERAAVVVQMYELAANGVGARTIAKTLNEQGIPPFGRDYHHKKSTSVGWEHTYVGDLLRSPAVEGDYTPGLGRSGRHGGGTKTGERFVGYFPRIVDADLVARARASIASRRGKGGRGRGCVRLDNLFGGMGFCGACGGRMRMISNSAKVHMYLVCQTAFSGRACTQNQSFAYRPFEKAALDALLPLAMDDSYFERPDQTQALAIEIAEANKAIAVKQEAARNFGQAIGAGKASPTLLTMLAEAEDAIAAYQAKVVELEASMRIAKGTVGPDEHLRRVLEVRSSLNHEDPATRLHARRMVIEALSGLMTKVVCQIQNGEKAFVLSVLNNVGMWRFDMKGNTLGQVDVIALVKQWAEQQPTETIRAGSAALALVNETDSNWPVTRAKVESFVRRYEAKSA